MPKTTMTGAERAAAMVEAAKRRTEATQLRAAEALRRLDATGEPVSFAAVAREAGVSRAWLYRNTLMRAEIDRRRAYAHAPGPRLPAAERATGDSLREQLEALRERARHLEHENHRLRDALAHNLGRQRADGRAGDR